MFKAILGLFRKAPQPPAEATSQRPRFRRLHPSDLPMTLEDIRRYRDSQESMRQMGVLARTRLRSDIKPANTNSET